LVSSGEVQAVVARAVVGAVCRQLQRVEATPVEATEMAARDLAPKLTSQKMVCINKGLCGPRGQRLFTIHCRPVQANSHCSSAPLVPLPPCPLPLPLPSLDRCSCLQITIIEASRRLDAVASGGLGLSRSRVVKMIDKGEVLVNFREATSTAAIVHFGDIISLKNGAKLVVDEVTTTSKGKYRINLRRSGSDQRKQQQAAAVEDED
jgi:RNA-binding protein YlmH